MKYHFDPRKRWLTVVLFFFILFFSPLGTPYTVCGEVEQSLQTTTPASPPQQPLIVFYSRTGKTRIVANALARRFSCTMEEIQSTENREGLLGAFTCVLDQLLDRDDRLLPCNQEMIGYNPIIFVTPVWLGKVSSPMRTFMKQINLQGKEVYMFLTYNGRFTEEKEKMLLDGLAVQHITLRRLYKIITKDKSEDELVKDLNLQLEERPLRMMISGTF